MPRTLPVTPSIVPPFSCRRSYNEASSLALGNLDGVAHAVCNTVKRVVIMVAMSVFDKPLTAQKWTGAG